MKIKNYFKNYNLITVSLIVIFLFFAIYFVFAKNESSNSVYRNIGATEAQKIITSNTSLKVLDVRTKEEYEEGHIAGATNLDFYGNSFKNDLSKLNKDDTYLVYCRSGNRSGQTLSIMKDLGFKNVYNLSNGIKSPYFDGQLIKGEQSVSNNSLVSQKTSGTDLIKNALDEAINDEYRAHAFYSGVIMSFGEVRPFSMIIQSEQNHIDFLKSLYKKYNLEIPKDNNVVKKFDGSLSDACKIGVDAETENLKLYKNKLIPSMSSYTDIVEVFNNLMNASEFKHLPAFTKCS